MKIVFLALYAFLSALIVNIALFSSNSWKMFLWDVLQSRSFSHHYADLFLEWTRNNEGTKIVLKNSKPLYQVQSISFSVLYNPELWELKQEKLFIPSGNIETISKGSGVHVYTLYFSHPQDIFPHRPFFEMLFERKKEGILQVNLIHAQFTDSKGNSFHMTTSWIQF